MQFKTFNEKIEHWISQTLNEQFDSNKEETKNPVPYLYHCAKRLESEDEGYKSIFKKGFRRYYIASGVGNMYGPGVYTTTDLESSVVNAKRGEYGRVIIKAKFRDPYGFLIWNHVIAKRVYGNNWRMEDQFRLLMPEEVIEQMKKMPLMTEKFNGSLFDYVTMNREFTSKCAYQFWNSIASGRYKGVNPDDYFDGFMFHGERDGHVAVVKDVTNVQPLEYSMDFGKTWEYGRTTKYEKYAETDFDAEYKFGKRYKKVFPTQFGYSRVVNNQGKFNYIDKDGKEFSNVWLDGAEDFHTIEGDIYMATIKYNGKMLFLLNDGTIYEDPTDPFPFCDNIENLPECV